MVEDGEAYRFLSGAEMDPAAVLAAEPAARFVARARLGTGTASDDVYYVWGILIRVPAGGFGVDVGEEREVTTDDGRSFAAAVDGAGRPRGGAAAVLAAARYWELPPAYVRRLAGADGGDGDR